MDRPLIEDPDVVDAIAELLADAPPLTGEQKDRLRSLLAPSTREAPDQASEAA